jgi:sporulation protein YlmC with PRC-barrel domain
MELRVSDLLGKKIYTEKGKYIGTVEDVVLDLLEKQIAFLCLVPIENKSPTELVRIFKEKAIPYENVKSAAEIVIVKED